MCAAPTAPTADTIVTEALNKAFHSNPSTILVTRAKNYWLEEVKYDLVNTHQGSKLKMLQTTSIAVLTEGQSRYSNPTDYLCDMEVDILFGSNYGIAQAGAAGSVTLAADESIGGTDIVGRNTVITSGTGVASMSQCTAYNSTTKVNTVTPDFTTAPTAGSGYMVIDTYHSLIQKPIWGLSETTQQTKQGPPTHYFPIGDADYGEIELWPVPYTTDDRVYVVRMRYYANLLTLDLSGTLMATFYQKARGVLVQGVLAKVLMNNGDKRADMEIARYTIKLNEFAAQEIYGKNLNNLQMTVSD